MTAALVLGTLAARQRRLAAHRAWMLRAYALGMGAGTQVLTHLPWAAFPDLRSTGFRTLFMGLGWAINLAVAEWVLRRHRQRPARSAFVGG
jgi:hypothetical protein